MVRDVHDDYIMIHIRATSTYIMYLSHGNDKTAFKASEKIAAKLNMKNNAETAMGQPVKSKKRFLQCQDPRTMWTERSILGSLLQPNLRSSFRYAALRRKRHRCRKRRHRPFRSHHRHRRKHHCHCRELDHRRRHRYREHSRRQ